MAYTTIDDSEAYFQVKLYTGNGSTQSLTLGGDTDMQPDLDFIKGRDIAAVGNVSDSVRGVNKQIQTASGVAQETLTTCVTAFNSDGFSLGSNGNVNTNTNTYVAWCWKESATAGFDIDAYDGTGSARTEAHSLSAVPEWIIVKELDNAGSWYTYTAMMGNTKAMFLNATNAVSADSSGYWNDTTPTSSVFSLGTDGGVNQSSTGYVAYLWRSIQGFSKFGSYTGGSDPFVYLGFRPAFIMFKNTSATENWRIIDNKRDTYNPAVAHVYPNLTNAEGSGASYSDYCDFLSNGFKIISGSGEVDGSGNTIMYMAFAEQPFVNSEGVPCNAR